MAAASEAKGRGLKEITLKTLYGAHGRYLLKFWKPETPLRIFTAKEVAWFIRTALSMNRNPNTLIDQDLKILRHALLAAGMAEPIHQAQEDPQSHP
ncbi:MAG: hypothetical protein GY930_22800 [bacterium]|nr:hypothetical protein [bacterium]